MINRWHIFYTCWWCGENWWPQRPGNISNKQRGQLRGSCYWNITTFWTSTTFDSSMNSTVWLASCQNDVPSSSVKLVLSHTHTQNEEFFHVNSLNFHFCGRGEEWAINRWYTVEKNNKNVLVSRVYWNRNSHFYFRLCCSKDGNAFDSHDCWKISCIEKRCIILSAFKVPPCLRGYELCLCWLANVNESDSEMVSYRFTIFWFIDVYAKYSLAINYINKLTKRCYSLTYDA